MSSSAEYLHSRSSSKSRSFYALPDNKPTASSIIRESREWLQTVSTQRPFTPLTHARSLFGQPFCNDVLIRPLSAIKQSGTNVDQLASTNFRMRPMHKPQEVRKCDRNRNVSIQRRCDGAGPYTSLASNKSTSNKISDGSNVTQRQVKARLSTDRPDFYLQGTGAKLQMPALPNITSPTAQSNLQQATPYRDARSELNYSGYKLVAETSFLGDRGRVKAGSFQTSTRGEVQSSEARPKESVVLASPAAKNGLSPSRGSTSSSTASPFPFLPLLKHNTPVSELGLQSGSGVLHQRPATDSGCRSSAALINMKENGSVKLDGAGSTRKIRSGCLPGRESSVPVAESPISRSKSSESGDSRLSSWTDLEYLVSEILELSSLILPSDANRDGESEVLPGNGLRSIDPRTLPSQESKVGDLTEPVEDEVIHLMDRLYASLQDGELHSKLNWPQLAQLLQALFPLLGNTSERLQLALIRLILTIGVSDSKLVEVCKVLYKLAKIPSNDEIFVQDPEKLDVFHIALRCSQLSAKTTSTSSPEGLETQQEALLFLCGALKFLFTSPAVGALLNCEPVLLSEILRVHQNAEKWLRSQHTQNTEGSLDEDGGSDRLERIYGIMFQISEIFCQLSTRKESRSWLLTPEGVMDHILDCLLYRVNGRGGRDVPCAAIDIPPPKSTQYLVFFNWIRLLARLTESTEACRRLTGCYEIHSLTSDDTRVCDTADPRGRIQDLCKAMVTVCELFPEEQNMLVRVAYLLGNLCARSDVAREALLPDQSAMRTVLALCERHMQLQAHSRTDGGTQVGAPSTASDLDWNFKQLSEMHAKVAKTESEDTDVPLVPQNLPDLHLEVLVKLVRIIVNATINEHVGLLAVTAPDCLDLFLNLIAAESKRKSSELLLNCLAGLNNVTYYINTESPLEVATRQYDIAEALLGSVLPGNTNPDVILGCIRVFGNLSRQASVRNWLLYHGGTTLLEAANSFPTTDDEAKVEIDDKCAFLHFITQYLDSARPELVYSTLGVLINLMADGEQRPIFRKLGGPAKLLDVLRDFAGHDWQLAGLACKTIWNYTETQEESIQQLIPGENLDELYVYLSEFTDETVVSRLHHSIIAETNAEADSMELWQTVWFSEFLPVARELLYRITHT